MDCQKTSSVISLPSDGLMIFKISSMKKILLPILASALLSGCISSKKIAEQLHSWMGSNKTELIQQWGPPNQIVSDGSDGEILIYSQRIYAQLSTGATIDYYLYKMMFSNKEGKLYHWYWRKDPNPPERVDVRMLVTYK